MTSSTTLLVIMKYMSRPESAAVKDIDIADILGSEISIPVLYRYWLWRYRSTSKVKEVKYVDLYSASSWSIPDALPFSISRRWSPQANPTATRQRTLRDHVILVGAPCDMPAYSPGLRQVLIPGSSLDRLRLSRPRCHCLVPRRGGLPVQAQPPT